MERRDSSSLSFEEFFHRYALTHTPVVITGVVESMTTIPWTLDHIKKVGSIVCSIVCFSIHPLVFLSDVAFDCVSALIKSGDGPQDSSTEEGSARKLRVGQTGTSWRVQCG